ncbi:MAG TPA: hypothetical protein VLV15_02770 [Dongiaceae bacterium]|nr:hypothetical protein [Dongiaceae bacterium]
MFIVRETFNARPGMASKLATMIKQVMSEQRDLRVRILTDFVGPFNTVVMETEVPDLADFDRRMKEYMERDDIRTRMKGYTDMYQTGGREIYRVV